MDIEKIKSIDDLEIVSEERQWGSFTQFAHNQVCNVKILHVYDEQRLSLQKHFKRIELWVALDDGLTVELNGEIKMLKKGESFFIPIEGEHRLSAPEKGGRVLEIAFGENFDENDEIRLEDDYGRGNPVP